MTRQEHADAVVANLRAGKIDAREVILPPPPPVDADDLAPWMRETARPTDATTPPRAVSIDGLTLAEVRASWFDLHHKLNVATLETNALRQSCEVFERAHNIAVEQLVAKRDEAGALREAVGLAEKVIADLRRQIEELTCDLDGSTDGYRARIRDLQRERGALQGRVVELEEHLRLTREERDEARASHDKLWPELVELRRGAVSK